MLRGESRSKPPMLTFRVMASSCDSMPSEEKASLMRQHRSKRRWRRCGRAILFAGLAPLFRGRSSTKWRSRSSRCDGTGLVSGRDQGGDFVRRGTEAAFRINCSYHVIISCAIFDQIVETVKGRYRHAVDTFALLAGWVLLCKVLFPAPIEAVADRMASRTLDAGIP
jgi:hypothetical protein